jgi:tRNA 2-thiocytidine biosynthesis protein TtcA
MLKKVNRAIREFNMVEEGDRIAVGLSGGKDSWTLLSLLRYRQRFAGEKYSVVALHVLGDARGPETPEHPPLKDWLLEHKVEHVIRPSHTAPDESLPMPCHRCTWNRRRTLFAMAEEAGCNKLAFGHHLDDLAETALMNLTRHGRCDTMAPVREYVGGKLTLIRPMIYLPEHEIVRYAGVCGFPSPPPACPLGGNTERARVKGILTELKKGCRDASQNLVRASLNEWRREKGS